MEVVVCDDNELFLQTIEKQLKSLPMVKNIFLFSNLNKFLFSVDQGKCYDVVLMDIEWDEKSIGIDVASELYKLCPRTKIIYVTGHLGQFSQQIFLYSANLSGYLAKPVDIELLRKNLRKVADELDFQKQTSLVLKQKGTLISIPLQEINFIQSQGHTILVNTNKETIKAYEQLENILHSLPVGFYQCHRSFVVNMNLVRRIQSNCVFLKNGYCVPMSRARYASMKDAYFSYMGQKFYEDTSRG